MRAMQATTSSQETVKEAGIVWRGEPLLSVRDLRTYFPAGRRGVFGERAYVKAVDGVSFDVYKGETLGLVGESGCGKSTTGRTVLRLARATSGQVLYEGRDLCGLSDRAMRRMRPPPADRFPGPLRLAQQPHARGVDRGRRAVDPRAGAGACAGRAGTRVAAPRRARSGLRAALPA